MGALFVILGLLVVVQVKAEEFSWRDDFNYASLQAMRSGGWDLANPNGTRLESDGVVLDGTKGDTSINCIGHFPTGIYNWTIEIRAMWLGHGHSQPAIYVGTSKHNYGFVADGWGSQYGLYRDGAKPITFGSYKEQANVWVTLRLEKQANILSMYCDGALVNVYTEQDTSLSQLGGVSTISPWRGDEKYDYYRVSSSVSVADTSSGFPILYIAVGGGVAAVALIGAVAYFLFFAGGTGAAAGALAGGVAAGTAGAALGGVGGAVAWGLAGSDVFESVMSNLFFETVTNIMSDLGYDCSSLTAPDVFGQPISGDSAAGLSSENTEIASIYEIIGDYYANHPIEEAFSIVARSSKDGLINRSIIEMEGKEEKGIMGNVNTGWGDSVQVGPTELEPSSGTEPPESSQSEQTQTSGDSTGSGESTGSGTSSE